MGFSTVVPVEVIDMVLVQLAEFESHISDFDAQFVAHLSNRDPQFVGHVPYLHGQPANPFTVPGHGHFEIG